MDRAHDQHIGLRSHTVSHSADDKLHGTLVTLYINHIDIDNTNVMFTIQVSAP